MNRFVVFFVIIAVVGLIEAKDQIWEEDLGEQFKIEPSTKGVQKVNLRCGADSMRIELKTEEDFEGVMYTRGSFYKQAEPCFVKPKRKGKTLEMRFNLDQCQTINEGNVFSNVVVVQHDPELVTPGDSAFIVECDFRKPRGITVNAEYNARDSTPSSKITLTSPDPSVASNAKYTRNKRDTISSDSDTVTFIPDPNSEHGSEVKVRGTVEDVPVNDNDDENANEIRKTKDEL